MNNYNSNNEMENIELSVFRDSGLAQSYFDDSFTTLHTDRNQCDMFVFGLDLDVCDLFNFSKCTYKDFRSFVMDLEGGSERDIIAEKLSDYFTWQDFAEQCLVDIGLYQIARDGTPTINNAVELYGVAHAQGSCQGQYAYVFYKKSDFESEPNFSRELYDAPIYARLDVDGEEYYLDQELGGIYEWDTDKIKNYVKSLDISGKAKDWICENIPEYPEYY